MYTAKIFFPCALSGVLLIGACGDPAGEATEQGTDPLLVRFPVPTSPYVVTDISNPQLAVRAAASGAQVLGGDFDGDDRLDVAIVGAPGVSTVVFGFGDGAGAFSMLEVSAPVFAERASRSGVRAVVGDFDRDGRSDIALFGNSGFTSIPIAFCRANHTLVETNFGSTFATSARASGARVHAGDFDGDGADDLLVVGADSSVVPVAWSRRDGRFDVTTYASSLAAAARGAGVLSTVGDFDANGQDDLALAGGSGWTGVQVGLSMGDGRFRAQTYAASTFATLARTSGARLHAGDTNGDGYEDLLMVGGAGWTTIPTLGFRANGTVIESQPTVRSFPGWAAQTHVTSVAGYVDRDDIVDLVIAGGGHWSRLPTARGNPFRLALPPSDAEQGLFSEPTVACAERPSPVMEAIDELCRQLPWCDVDEPICRSYTRELAAGTTLFRQRDGWSGHGGHGRALAEAALCLVKDLEHAPAPPRLDAATSYAMHRVGYLGWDKTTRTVSGFQNVKLCPPIIGCLTTPAQTFQLTLRRSSPERPGGSTSGDFEAKAAYALELVADETQQGFELQVPPIRIVTPYGPIDVSPYLFYSSDFATIANPEGPASTAELVPTRTLAVENLFGRTPAVEHIDGLAIRETGGFWSQLAMGSRGALPDAEVWNGSGLRPDLDLLRPRSSDEHKPAHQLHGDVDIRYRPLGLLPEALRRSPFRTTFEVYTILNVDARATAQLSLATGQGFVLGVDHDRRRSVVRLQYASEVAESLGAVLGVRIKVEFSVPFLGYRTLVDKNLRTNIPVASPSEHYEGPVAWADVDADPAAPIYYDEVQSWSGAPMGDRAAARFVGACLAGESHQSQPPPAEYDPPSEPWAPSIPYPCNICVGAPSSGYGNPVVVQQICPSGPCPVTDRAPSASGNWTCGTGSLGCFDVCQIVDGVPKVIETAVQNNAASCGGAPR